MIQSTSSGQSSTSPRDGGGAPPSLSAQLFEQILHAASDNILCVDHDWRIAFVNRAAQALLGTDDLLGVNLWTRFPGNRLEPFASHYRLTMEQRVSTEFEAYSPALARWLKIRAEPYDDGIVIFSCDVTDRKQTEAVRDSSQRQLDQVMEATTDAIVSLARDWTYSYLNKQAVALLGREDLLGKNMWVEFPSTTADELLRQTMEDRRPNQFDVHNPAPLNSWFRVQARPSDDGIVVFFRDVTEERASRQDLLDQQATLAFVQQTARVATWQLDLAAGSMLFGEGSFPVFGRHCSEIPSVQEFRTLVHPSDLANVRASTEAAIRSGTVQTVEYRVLAPDGTILHVEGHGVALYNEHGTPTHLRGMTTDITARKQSEEQLRTSEERYRVLSDLNPQALWVGAPDGTIVYANQGYLEYIGKTPADLGGLDWLTAFDPEDHERVVAAWSHSIESGDEYAIEARLIRARDGSSRWWFLRALPVRNAEGFIQQWIGVSNEIHDHKTSAEALRQKQMETERHRAELEAIYETAPIGLALFDPADFRWLRLNESQAEIFGMHKEELLNTPLFDLVKIEGVRELFERVASGTPVLDQLVEGELPRRPGEKRMWRVNYVPIFAPDGSVQAITSATLEITREKKAEAALVQSEKLAAVGRLASSISHEINNPLEAITNILYIVGSDPNLPDSVRTYVDMAQGELARVSQIATQTLRFHRHATHRTAVTARDLVGAVLNLYQGRLSNSGITVDATYASQSSLFCFENDIRQVLNNLIANAIDAMRTGGRLIVRAHDTSGMTCTETASTQTGSTPAGHRQPGVRITVADTGHGMSQETMTRVFEPFYTTKDLNGTGLGLWISAGIVAHHEGRLTVRSSQYPTHRGTVFTLFLPLRSSTS